MIQFTIKLYDNETGNSLFSRKQLSWPVLPRVGEEVYIDCSTDKLHDAELLEVTYIYHFIEDDVPYICLDFAIEYPFQFNKFKNQSDRWVDSERELRKYLR